MDKQGGPSRICDGPPCFSCQRAGRKGVGEVRLERDGIGMAVVGDQPYGLQRCDLFLGHALPPEPGALEQCSGR